MRCAPMAHKRKRAKALPKNAPIALPGAVCAQYVRCKKAGCRCNRGAPHGPYFYRFWREQGKLRKAYVRPRDLQIVRAACARHRRERTTQRADVRQAHTTVRSLLAELRRMQWSL